MIRDHDKIILSVFYNCIDGEKMRIKIKREAGFMLREVEIKHLMQLQEGGGNMGSNAF